ncbi:hypothetical protein S245_001490 [Arachis hypogaea]
MTHRLLQAAAATASVSTPPRHISPPTITIIPVSPIVYRERLDRTFASPDLTNDEMLKKLVESQLVCSSKQEVECHNEKCLEMKTIERKIVAARTKFEKLEEEIKKATTNLVSQAGQIEELKLQGA